MELIERYVNDVGRRLPRRQRAEVRRELRSALLDAVEQEQPAESSAPTEDQVVAALRRLGPPEAVAASYRPADQYLIGPELFPYFKRVLGIVTTVLLGLLVAAFALSMVARPAVGGEPVGVRLLGLLGGLVNTLWVTFTVVVLLFAGLQRIDVRPQRKARVWDPRKLPAVRDADLAGRGEMAFSVVVAGLFLALLHVFRDAIGIVVRPGGELLLNDVLLRYLPWASAALLASMALHAYLFWRGRWEWPTRLIDLAIDLCGLAVLQRVAAAVTAQKPTLESSLPAPVPTMLVQLAWSVFAVVAFFVAWSAGRMIVRAVRGG